MGSTKNSMKYTIIVMIIISCAACISAKNKLTHDFPKEMSEVVKADYIKQWEKGRVLYDINCSKCHDTKVKGRTVVPDFSQDKLIGYGLRVANQRHESNLTDESVNTEELGLIMTFLSYKKKNPAAKRPNTGKIQAGKK